MVIIDSILAIIIVLAIIISIIIFAIYPRELQELFLEIENTRKSLYPVAAKRSKYMMSTALLSTSSILSKSASSSSSSSLSLSKTFEDEEKQQMNQKSTTKSKAKIKTKIMVAKRKSKITKFDRNKKTILKKNSKSRMMMKWNIKEINK